MKVPHFSSMYRKVKGRIAKGKRPIDRNEPDATTSYNLSTLKTLNTIPTKVMQANVVNSSKKWIKPTK